MVFEEFWKNLNYKEKAFVLAHEALHIYYGHGVRDKAFSDYTPEQKNDACDLSINERLLSQYGFFIEDMENIEKLNIVRFDSFAKHYNIDSNTLKQIKKVNTFESNLVSIPKQQDEQSSQKGNTPNKDKKDGDQNEEAGGSGNGQGNSTSDKEDDGKPDSPFGKIDRNIFEDKKDNEDSDSGDSTAERELIESEVKRLFEENGINPENLGNEMFSGTVAGTGSGSFTNVNVIKKKKKKFESIIIKTCKKMIKIDDTDEESWIINRRKEDLYSRLNVLLPTENTIENITKEKDKKHIFAFLDISGSCYGYKDRFVKILASIPEDKFVVRSFSFDERVEPINRTGKSSYSIYGGGGTSFAPIEGMIQKIMKEENEDYPDAVFIITDGYGTAVHPEKPNRWHWMLTGGSTTSYIPKESKVYDLKKFE